MFMGNRIALQNNWRLGDRPELGMMNRVNTIFRKEDMLGPFALPNFDQASTILIGSDYSGQHTTSKYESYAFVIADFDRMKEWDVSRQYVRDTFLRDGRRFSFKAINDSKRAAALPAFLRSIDLIPGLLLVVLIEKSLKTLFSHTEIDHSDVLSRELSLWPPHVKERLFRVLHINSLLIAGLTHPGQNLLWITDQDDVVANETRHRQATSAFARALGHYLQHDLGHIRVATTKSDSGKRDVEDFVAIADFAAGSVCEVLSAYQNSGMPLVEDIVLPAPPDMSEKTSFLSNWFSIEDAPLRRLVISIDPKPVSDKLIIKQWKFHGITTSI